MQVFKRVYWLNQLMLNYMNLPMRKTTTKAIPTAISDCLETMHHNTLYRLAYLVWKYKIPPALVVSCDQSGLNLFPRRDVRRDAKDDKHVARQGAEDKHVTAHIAIAGDGSVLPPQVIFEGTTATSLLENAPVYFAPGWQFRFSYNHWSLSHLVLDYLAVIDIYFPPLCIVPWC